MSVLSKSRLKSGVKVRVELDVDFRYYELIPGDGLIQPFESYVVSGIAAPEPLIVNITCMIKDNDDLRGLDTNKIKSICVINKESKPDEIDSIFDKLYHNKILGAKFSITENTVIKKNVDNYYAKKIPYIYLTVSNVREDKLFEEDILEMKLTELGLS